MADKVGIKIDSRDWRRLSFSVGEINLTLEAALRVECGLLLSELALLESLLNSKERSLRMGELRELLLLSPSGLTRVVDRLVRKQWLRRAAVSVDKRGSAVVLTPRGLACYLRAKDVSDRVLREALMERFTGPELSLLARALATPPASSASH
jgi:DNA-binding MarR family transcriptional regulator